MKQQQNRKNAHSGPRKQNEIKMKFSMQMRTRHPCFVLSNHGVPILMFSCAASDARELLCVYLDKRNLFKK